MDVWITELYFDCLAREAFEDPKSRTEYEGLLRVLHDIPFYWVMWEDENRAGDALSFRQYDFLSTHVDDPRNLPDARLTHAWANAQPSTLEVLLAIARRWGTYYEAPTAKYFLVLLHNLGFARELGHHPLPHHRAIYIRNVIDIWLSRQFNPDGHGSPFPLWSRPSDVDMRTMDIWRQMHIYASQHPQLFT